MNLRQRLFDNRILARAQAALIALTYIFLCTFGMLSHTHMSEEAYQPSHDRVAGSTVSRRTTLRAHSSSQRVTASTHCAFCEWQANSNALPVVPLRLNIPLTIACVHLRQTTPVAPVFTTRSSSRAPPICQPLV